MNQPYELRRRMRLLFGPVGAPYERRRLRRVRVATRWAWHSYLQHIDQHVDAFSKAAGVVALFMLVLVLIAAAARGDLDGVAPWQYPTFRSTQATGAVTSVYDRAPSRPEGSGSR